jgi:2-keto-4-pentenoate hydratase
MRNSLIINVIFCLMSVVGLPEQALANVDALAKQLLSAHEKLEPIPNLSSKIGPDMAAAYQVQTLYVKGRLVNDKVAGFKAGLTTAASQNQFGINRPISGVLFTSGDFSKAHTVSLQKFNRLMIETEIGYITKKPILKTVQSVEQLKSYIKEVVPVIELPDLGFKDQKINARDLIAANAVSAGYIIFRDTNWLNQDVNKIAVTLFHNGIIVNQGYGEDTLGDQWEALRWLVNHVIANGWTIGEGNLLITGSLGEVILAKPGVYRAQYNNGPKFEFVCE